MDESRKLHQQMSLATKDMREVQVKASAMAKKVGDARKELGLIRVARLKKREEGSYYVAGDGSAAAIFSGKHFS